MADLECCGVDKEKSEVAKQEEKILRFWQEHKIFEKSLAQTAQGQEFVFYDGPPFATGLPHYGHIVPGTIKDVIPRYQTMRGRFVRRRWGWDCHGLPVETLVEKELNLNSRKDIENYGIEAFNEKIRSIVLRYTEDWRQIIARLGRFVDMDNAYRTMDARYTESVLSIFKTLHDQGLIYEGYKSMQICPRCETTLSNFEVNQGYKDITDISVYVKFELVDEPGTYLLAWTTTPWTLPGNVALAVGEEIVYGQVVISGKRYIIAKNILEKIRGEKEHPLWRALSPTGEKVEIGGELRGVDLVGKNYRPIFDYYRNDVSFKNRDNGWKIYGADFVTTEEGTGIVHIAPAFGADDMKLGEEHSLPFIQHVGMDGHFRSEVKDFAGLPVKPKDHHQDTDIEIIKFLAKHDHLFAKEKITHPYPHCWRCATPLLNYAATSWFIEVTKFRAKLVAANEEISWVPAHVKKGRFGKWLEGARDWAISRPRFWGAPLPVWRCQTCAQLKVVGNVADLAGHTGDQANRYWVMRHGQAESNLHDRISSHVDDANHLTPQGREEAKASAQTLLADGVEVIIASDFMRTRETAEIVAGVLGMAPADIVYDPRLREINLGVFEGEKWSEYLDRFSTRQERYHFQPEGGESYAATHQRVAEVLYDINERHQGKKILIVTHGLPLFFAKATAQGWAEQEICAVPTATSRVLTGSIYPLNFFPLPHNARYELDWHRPYIDRLEFPCACGGVMKRVPEVLDCWFESGAMPYAQAYYPFASGEVFNPEKNVGWPADFIAEGLDQTRGWFYTMLVFSTALFGRSSYKQVVTNGLVLAEDGRKISKSLKNYPDPLLLVNRYGADALRFYLLASPVVRGEDLAFSERGVEEVYRKVIQRLTNVVSFYDLHREPPATASPRTSPHPLDRWIIARLNQAITEVDQSLARYELDHAVRPLADLIEDLSNWYVRRSRQRLKGADDADRADALHTLVFVLQTLARLLAPFVPFIAEWLYQKTGGEKESVHLESWPAATPTTDTAVLSSMSTVRKLVEMGLAARETQKIKIRQPLAELRLGETWKLGEEYFALLADELNIKKVSVANDSALSPNDGWLELTDATGSPSGVFLHTTLSPELVAEGQLRELVRTLQDWRKKNNLTPREAVSLRVTTGQSGRALVEKFLSEITQAVNLSEITILEGAGTEKVGEHFFSFERYA